jgi:hypothetical protein
LNNGDSFISNCPFALACRSSDKRYVRGDGAVAGQRINLKSQSALLLLDQEHDPAPEIRSVPGVPDTCKFNVVPEPATLAHAPDKRKFAVYAGGWASVEI